MPWVPCPEITRVRYYFKYIAQQSQVIKFTLYSSRYSGKYKSQHFLDLIKIRNKIVLKFQKVKRPETIDWLQQFLLKLFFILHIKNCFLMSRLNFYSRVKETRTSIGHTTRIRSNLWEQFVFHLTYLPVQKKTWQNSEKEIFFTKIYICRRYKSDSCILVMFHGSNFMLLCAVYSNVLILVIRSMAQS